MAARTPGLQARSGFHAYWGQFVFDGSGPQNTYGALGRAADVGANELPNAANNPIPLSEFNKLEAGDTAATIISSPSSGQTALFGLWTCIYPGTAGAVTGNGNAVWIRLDNQASNLVQTIRDAHRIVVGIAGTTHSGDPLNPDSFDTLLNLTPYTAGVSADFIDMGDGNEFETAMFVAGAIALAAGSRPIDVRVVSGQINFGAATGTATLPILVPSLCRLLGAGRTLTEFVGRNTLGASQKVFVLGSEASIEDLSITSKAPTALEVGTAGGVVAATGNFSARNINISMSDDANNRVTRFGIFGAAAVGLSIATLDNVSVSIDSVTTAGAVGIRLEDYTRSTISNVKVDGADYGVAFIAVGAGTAKGNSVTRFTGTGIKTAALFVGAENNASTSHLSFSDSSVTFGTFGGGPVSEQYMVQITALSSNAVNQMSVSGCHTEFGFNATATTQAFARVRTAGTARILGLSFVGCGIVSDSGSFTYGNPTQGLILDNNSTDTNSIRGGDLLCDFAGVGPAPLAGSAIIDYRYGLGAGATLWEHAHPTGLA